MIIIRIFLELFGIFLYWNFEDLPSRERETWIIEGRWYTSRQLALTRSDFNVIDILNMDLPIFRFVSS